MHLVRSPLTPPRGRIIQRNHQEYTDPFDSVTTLLTPWAVALENDFFDVGFEHPQTASVTQLEFG